MAKQDYLVWGRDPKTNLAGGMVVSGKLKAKQLKARWQKRFKYKFNIRKYQ